MVEIQGKIGTKRLRVGESMKAWMADVRAVRSFTAKLHVLLLWAFLAAAQITGIAEDNVVIRWDNAALQEVRYLHPGPQSLPGPWRLPIHACSMHGPLTTRGP